MGRKIKVDMTGVESFVKCDIGEHVAKIVSIEEGQSQAGNDTLNVKFQVVKGSSAKAVVYDTVTLTESAMWKFKSLLEAVGQKSDGKLVVDLDKIEGKTCIISVIHEEYKGSMKAKIDGYKKLQASKASDDDDEDDEDFENDEEEEEEPAPKKKAKKEESKKKKGKKAPEPEDDEDDFEDDDDEEVEPEPKKDKKKSSKKAEQKSAPKEEKKAKKDTKKAPPKDEDEDDEWEDDDDEWDEE